MTVWRARVPWPISAVNEDSAMARSAAACRWRPSWGADASRAADSGTATPRTGAPATRSKARRARATVLPFLGRRCRPRARARRGYAPQRHRLPSHRAVDVGVGRFRDRGEQRRRSQDLAGLAVAAFRSPLLDPGLRQRVAVVGMEPIDRGHLPPIHDGDCGEAGADGSPVHQDGAGAALGDSAALLRLRQVERVAQSPQQGQVRIDVARLPSPVLGPGDWRLRPGTRLPTGLSAPRPTPRSD